MQNEKSKASGDGHVYTYVRWGRCTHRVVGDPLGSSEWDVGFPSILQNGKIGGWTSAEHPERWESVWQDGQFLYNRRVDSSDSCGAPRNNALEKLANAFDKIGEFIRRYRTIWPRS